MKLPGFTAEESLYKLSRIYEGISSELTGANRDGVVPQARPNPNPCQGLPGTHQVCHNHYWGTVCYCAYPWGFPAPLG